MSDRVGGIDEGTSLPTIRTHLTPCAGLAEDTYVALQLDTQGYVKVSQIQLIALENNIINRLLYIKYGGEERPHESYEV